MRFSKFFDFIKPAGTQADMLSELEKLPGGSEMLADAQQRDVVIRADKSAFSSGYMRRTPGQPSEVVVHARSNTAAMGSVLFHELRHEKQYAELGLEDSNRLNMAQAKNMLFNTLMLEADAHAQQLTAAVKAQRDGSPQAYEAYVAMAWPAEKKFLAQNPPQGFADDNAFARAAFTHHLTHLSHYRATAYAQIAYEFGKAHTLADFKALVGGQDAGLSPMQPPESLARDYGRDYAAGVDPRALRNAVIRALPLEERQLLRDVEKVARNAHKMTEDEYAKARMDIGPRASKISRNLESLKNILLDRTPPALRDVKGGLFAAAAMDAPPALAKNGLVARPAAPKPPGR